MVTMILIAIPLIIMAFVYHITISDRDYGSRYVMKNGKVVDPSKIVFVTGDSSSSNEVDSTMEIKEVDNYFN